MLFAKRTTALATCLLLGCGPGALGEAVAPKATTAAEALGDEELALTCRGIPEYGAPLIVDWSAQQRLDLEYRMNQGVAVVAYTCERFEVLDRCMVTGGYRFAGVSRKEDVVKLASRDELGVNLPFSGASLAASLERGSTIDLGLVLIGKKATTVQAVARPMLVGDCEGATHFVQAATVGAFAMDRGTVGKTRAAAEVFNASASGASDHESQTQSRDGDLQACRKASPDAEAPPGQCQAALRLDLVPIFAKLPKDAERATDPKAKAKASTPPPEKDTCPEGMVRQGDICAQPGPQEGALGCADGILADCERSCQAGDVEGCVRLASAYDIGNGVDRDRERAIALYGRACKAGHLRACTEAGGIKARCRKYQMAAPHACVKPGDLSGAAADLSQACDSGYGRACLNLGMGADELVRASGKTALRFLERACDLGEGMGCSLAGFAYLKGEGGAAKDVARGTELLRASCDGGELTSCMLLQALYEGKDDMGGERQPLKLLDLHRNLCRRGHKASCFQAGEMLTDRKEGIGANTQEAERYYELACQSPQPIALSCVQLGRYHMGEPQRALQYFSLACTYGGEGCLDAARIARAQTLPKLQKQCENGEGRACADLADALIEKGCVTKGGIDCLEFEKRNPEKALQQMRRHCLYFEGRDPEKYNCRNYLKRGGKLETR